MIHQDRGFSVISPEPRSHRGCAPLWKSRTKNLGFQILENDHMITAIVGFQKISVVDLPKFETNHIYISSKRNKWKYSLETFKIGGYVPHSWERG